MLEFKIIRACLLLSLVKQLLMMEDLFENSFAFSYLKLEMLLASFVDQKEREFQHTMFWLYSETSISLLESVLLCQSLTVDQDHISSVKVLQDICAESRLLVLS